MKGFKRELCVPQCHLLRRQEDCRQSETKLFNLRSEAMRLHAIQKKMTGKIRDLGLEHMTGFSGTYKLVL